jgi:hypothetical protein
MSIEATISSFPVRAFAIHSLVVFRGVTYSKLHPHLNFSFDIVMIEDRLHTYPSLLFPLHCTTHEYLL